MISTATGKAIFGCYYPAGGNWYVFKSTEGFWQTQFGYAGTIPLGGTLLNGNPVGPPCQENGYFVGFDGDANAVCLPVLPNYPPVLKAVGNKSVADGTLLEFKVEADDINNDPLLFSVSGLPAGATFNALTQVFSWIPSIGHDGTYSVMLSVSDGAESDSETVAIVVTSTRCEMCHNGNPEYPLAPNVMGNGDNPDGTGTTPKPYDNGTWGYNVNGHGANGTATNTPKRQIAPDVFVPYLTPNAACTDCHDISQPSTGDGRHQNGILNSVDWKLNPSENTAHLRTDGAYPFIVSGENAWDVQVGFDLACYQRCHQPSSVGNMRHARDLVLGPRNLNNVLNAVRFGDKGSIADGESILYPIDTALTTNASSAADDFAPCISCHNPHGTSVVEPSRTTNRMMRDQFYEQSTLCLTCHR